MKLTAVKCPNCSANIEINENLERAICQYCGSTILIENANKKHQIDIKGTIKIDGIQSNSEKIDIILNHVKIGELDRAIIMLNEILKNNPFNEEALSIYIQIQTAILNAANEELENINPILRIFYKEIDISEYIAYEQIEKLQAVVPDKYEDIIKEHYQIVEKMEKILKKQKLMYTIAKIVSLIIIPLFIFGIIVIFLFMFGIIL